MTYLEFDIILFELLSLPRIDNNTINLYINNITEEQTAKKVRLLVDRVLNTAFKRANPFNLEHPINKDRFELLNILDRSL